MMVVTSFYLGSLTSHVTGCISLVALLVMLMDMLIFSGHVTGHVVLITADEDLKNTYSSAPGLVVLVVCCGNIISHRIWRMKLL